MSDIKKPNFFTKQPLKQCVIFDKDNAVIFSGLYHDIPLKDTAIIEKSIELFSDPAPCFIHRGAVMVRICAELEDLCNSSDITALPPQMQYYIDLETAVYYCVK